MNIIWTINGRKLKRYALLIVAALFTAGLFYVQGDAFPVFQSTADTEEPRAIYKVATSDKKIALTFDISWGNERPGPILDVLESRGVKDATFFLSSPWAENHPDIVKRIHEQGFEIGSHGHKHDNYSTFKDDEIRQQLVKSNNILRSLTGKTPTLLRTPNGDYDKRVLRIAQELNFTVIQWNTDSRDWLNPGSDKIVQNVVEHVVPGDIILLHASDSSKQTHEALPQIIDRLQQDGYQFVTVSELLAGVKTNIKELQ
ncbi:polysaccharide deacetylase family sporulation protein PdaB [Bacillus horti]|uniref:Polysaccharide deacetylase family sporulation protein PdaB n=1 Tax=Caldalkalibacillus horti TaxID=77523 RepID=A0ABT9VYR9_9BACI|nr:polysaccharide deacetylase family sporulation protein PdaB [Bacillus horti]MDQ0166109.1 polysaccharide deacetylase family sporulation protein PdaB [Bacillus horti]